MKKCSVKHLAQAGTIAALYVALTWIGRPFASGTIQLRIAEALTVLPLFSWTAVPGLTVGCFLGNLLTGAALPDVLLGSLATLLGAIGTGLLRKKGILALLPPVLSNSLILPFVFRYAYGAEGPLWGFALLVMAGELLSVGVLGFFVKRALDERPDIFGDEHV